MSELATRILEITPEGPRDFPGTFSEYLERCGDDHLDADSVVLRAKSERKADDTETAKAASRSWEEQKRRRNRLAALPAQRDALLASIEDAEAKRAAIAARYGEPGFYERAGDEEITRMVAEDCALGGQIDLWMAEWEAVERELADP